MEGSLAQSAGAGHNGGQATWVVHFVPEQSLLAASIQQGRWGPAGQLTGGRGAEGAAPPTPPSWHKLTVLPGLQREGVQG